MRKKSRGAKMIRPQSCPSQSSDDGWDQAMIRPRPEFHDLSDDDWDQALNNNTPEGHAYITFANDTIREEWDRVIKTQRNERAISFIEEIMSRHHHSLLGWVRTFIRDEMIVEEIIQKCWVKLYLLLTKPELQKSTDFRFLINPKRRYRWLQAVLKNDALNYLRDQNRFTHLDPSEALLVLETRARREPSPERILAYQETQQDIRLLLQQLPVRQREVLFLHLYHALSFEEIARKLEVPASSVRCWYRRGCNRLRRIVTRDILPDNLALLLEHSIVREEQGEHSAHG
jgi:RNA polymerase sigma factor (sigma-70 family)